MQRSGKVVLVVGVTDKMHLMLELPRGSRAYYNLICNRPNCEVEICMQHKDHSKSFYYSVSSYLSSYIKITSTIIKFPFQI